MTKNKMPGIYVSDSIVFHMTNSNYSAANTYDWRFYYNVRNWLWFKRLHYGSLRYFFDLLKTLIKTFKLPKGYKMVNLKGCIGNLLKFPKIEYPEV